MEPSIDELRKNYRKFSDEKLIQIATTDAFGMRPETIQVIIEEIKVRGLSTDLIKGIVIQRRDITEEEIFEYCELMRKQPCPNCGSISSELNATIIYTVISFIIMTSYEEKLLIACPKCLRAANKHALNKSALFGWWGLPWGIYRTIKALFRNHKMSKQTHHKEPNPYFIGFVLDKIGIIEANKTNMPRLQELLKDLN